MSRFDSYRERIRKVASDHAEGKAKAFLENLRSEAFINDLVYEGLETYQHLITDRLPAPDLTGQWADEPTPVSVFAEAGIPENIKEGDRDELLDIYFSTFDATVWSTVKETVHPERGE